MKFLTALFKLIYTFAALIIGLVLASLLIASLTEKKYIYDLVDFVFANRVVRLYSGFSGLFLASSAVFVLLGGFFAKKPVRSIAYNNPEGEVTVSIKTIQDLIEKTAMEFREIKNISPAVKKDKKGIIISLKTHVWEGANIPITAQQLQKVVKERAFAILGLDNISSVEVNISKIIPRKNTKENPEIFDNNGESNDEL
ncbi:MAG: alkaline shock response membrane anchor protein AmaP [bacterium]|nr:alkaline shock response membrane anchor protein AmaP [bacterium]